MFKLLTIAFGALMAVTTAQSDSTSFSDSSFDGEPVLVTVITTINERDDIDKTARLMQ